MDKSGDASQQGEPPVRWGSRKGEDIYDSEVPERGAKKIPEAVEVSRPYHKPTQVGGLSILRRSREGS